MMFIAYTFRFYLGTIQEPVCPCSFTYVLYMGGFKHRY